MSISLHFLEKLGTVDLGGLETSKLIGWSTSSKVVVGNGCLTQKYDCQHNLVGFVVDGHTVLCFTDSA